jgi:hypothetical protein
VQIVQKYAATTVLEQILMWSPCWSQCSSQRSTESSAAYRTVTEINVALKVDGKGQREVPLDVGSKELEDLKKYGGATAPAYPILVAAARQ